MAGLVRCGGIERACKRASERARAGELLTCYTD